MTGEFKRLNLLRLSSLREGFLADKAIFTARINSMKDCFVVPPRNDDHSIGGCQSQRSQSVFSKHLFRST
jgi:hypothetical protein